MKAASDWLISRDKYTLFGGVFTRQIWRFQLIFNIPLFVSFILFFVFFPLGFSFLKFLIKILLIVLIVLIVLDPLQSLTGGRFQSSYVVGFPFLCGRIPLFMWSDSPFYVVGFPLFIDIKI